MPLRGFSKLLLASLPEATRKRYIQGVGQFLDYCKEHEIDADIETLDAVLADYFTYMYEHNQGAGKDTCAEIREAVLFFCPELKGKLPLAKHALVDWERLVPTPPVTPCPRALAVTLAYFGNRFYTVEFGVSILLSFDCYLHPDALQELRWKDIRLNEKNEEYPVVLDLARSQASPYVLQSALVRTPLLSMWLRRLFALHKGRDPEERPFALQNNIFNERLNNILVQHLKCEPNQPRITVDSLRYGGATHDYFADPENLSNVQVRGRWEKADTALQYVQAGVTALKRIKLPDSAQRLVHHINGDIHSYFNLPAGISTGWE